MSSEVALIGQAAAPSYVTTKAGQIGVTYALALDLAPAGVTTPFMEEWASSQYDRAAHYRWSTLGIPLENREMLLPAFP